MNDDAERAEAIEQHQILAMAFEAKNAAYVSAAKALATEMMKAVTMRDVGATGIQLQNKYLELSTHQLVAFTEDTARLATGLAEELTNLSE